MIFQHKSIQVDTIDAIRVEMTVEFVRWLDALDDAVKFRVVARCSQSRDIQRAKRILKGLGS